MGKYYLQIHKNKGEYPMEYQQNLTQLNLMRAFAGESQARNRYTIAASQARKKELYVLEKLFLYTAEQELAHANVFYEHLKESAGKNIHVDGTYPVDIAPTITKLLQMAHHNELEEADTLYPAFAEQADKDGFSQAAASFRMIAKIEAMHAERFRHFELLLSSDRLFTDDDTQCLWMCQNCGHLHTGRNAPELCPVCSHKQGYFLRADMSANTNPNILSLYASNCSL